MAIIFALYHLGFQCRLYVPFLRFILNILFFLKNEGRVSVCPPVIYVCGWCKIRIGRSLSLFFQKNSCFNHRLIYSSFYFRIELSFYHTITSFTQQVSFLDSLFHFTGLVRYFSTNDVISKVALLLSSFLICDLAEFILQTVLSSKMSLISRVTNVDCGSLF